MQSSALGHVPTAFVQDVLIKLAPRILAGADCLTVEETRETFGEPFPPFLRCSISPPSHLPEWYAIPPTHLLLLTFDGANVTNSAAAAAATTGGGEPLRMMVPIHEAVWTMRCHTVARLVISAASSSPSSPSPIPGEPTDTFELPVIPFPGSLPLAAFSTFTSLHTYLHTGTLPTHLPLPSDWRADDDASVDSDSDSGFDSESEFEDEEDEEIDPEEEEEEEEDEPLFILEQREQYEGLYRMCRAFGIDAPDPIYEWMAAAATTERWRRSVAAGEKAAWFARSKGTVADASMDDDDDEVMSSRSHLLTPPPG